MTEPNARDSGRLPSVRSTVVLSRTGDSQIGTNGEAALVALAGWEIGKTIPLDQDRIVLGRSPKCDVVVNTHSVSREHAVIERKESDDGLQYSISDLGSSNGTQVNGTPVVQSKLRADDKVRMGEVVFRFIQDDHYEKRFHEEVHRRIHYHDLTGLMTLPSTKERMLELLRSSPKRAVHSLAMTDLDGLKAVNDNHGHNAGSYVIETMGEMIRDVLHKDEFGGIYGGDECVLCFPNTPLSEAYKTVECLRTTIEHHRFDYDNQFLKVSMSIGLASWPIHGETLDDLMESADEALYEAKRSGRNRVVVAGEPQG